MRKAVQAAAMGRRSRSRKGEDAPGSGGSLTAPASPEQQQQQPHQSQPGSSSSAVAQQQAAPTTNGGSSNSSNSHGGGGGGISGMIALPDNTRRKATPEEAALTAKNYRLAKELSELRVRHREETRNVNRLTMENMNLASRCREAISHVGMLKKEVASLQQQQQQHHKKSLSQDTALATASSSRSTGSNGRRTPNRSSNNKSPTLLLSASKSPPRPPEAAPLPTNLKPHSGRALDMSREMDQMDQLLANRSNNSKNRPLRAGDIALSPSATPLDSEEADEEGPLADLPPKASLSPPNNNSFFPQSASPKLGRAGNYNEEFPGDITSVSRLNSRQRVATLGGFSETAEEDSQPLSGGSGDKNESVSSIDAFEASFTTNFPDSFSPTATSASNNNTVGTNGKEFAKVSASSLDDSAAYNPFSTSPQHATSLSSSSRRGAEAVEPGQIGSTNKQQLRPHRDPPGRNRTSLRTTTAGAFSPTLVAPNGARANRSSIASLSPASNSGKDAATSPPLSNGKRHVTATPPAKKAATNEFTTPPSAAIDNPDDRPSPLFRYEKAVQNKPNFAFSNKDQNSGTPETREPNLANLDQKLNSPRLARRDTSAMSLDERRRSRGRSVDSSTRSVDGKSNKDSSSKRDNNNSKQRDSPFLEKKADSTPPRVASLSSPKDFVSKNHHHQRSLSDAFGDKPLDSEEKKSDSGLNLDSPTLSVRDRAAMFSSDSSPRSPEAEQRRILAVSSPARNHVRAGSLDQVASPRSDVGDIPMVSTIKRTTRSFPSTPLSSAESGY